MDNLIKCHFPQVFVPFLNWFSLFFPSEYFQTIWHVSTDMQENSNMKSLVSQPQQNFTKIQSNTSPFTISAIMSEKIKKKSVAHPNQLKPTKQIEEINQSNCQTSVAELNSTKMSNSTNTLEKTPLKQNLQLSRIRNNNFWLSAEEQQQISDQNQDQHGPQEGFGCAKCGKVFAYAYYRDKHLKYTRCIDNGNRKFPCDYCTRSFEKRDRLRIHILHVHQNHRPHKCGICQKAFSQSSSLNKHLRVHNGDRPYHCHVCKRSFTASSILRTHIRQHSGEKPFKCIYCGKCFASHAAHDSHVRRTH